jgi:hypothetical protein
MTTTTTKTERGYDPYKAPPAPEGSRFAVNQTPAGITARPAEAAAHTLQELARDRIAEAKELTPPMKKVKLFAAARTTDGDYRLVPRGTVTARPSFETTYSGKFGGGEPSPRIIDDLLLGDEKVTKNVRDEVVWASLVELAASLQATGRDLRGLNDAVALALLIRQGIATEPFSLPNIPTEH